TISAPPHPPAKPKTPCQKIVPLPLLPKKRRHHFLSNGTKPKPSFPAFANLVAQGDTRFNMQPQPPQQQRPTSMDPFYERLLNMVFTGAKAATEYCRSLAREFGFTIKQETSSNKKNLFYRHSKLEYQITQLPFAQ
ncbi:hypothetical protein BC937DRAFT_87934, partial [Endogone sp. FLAS-F59071]